MTTGEGTPESDHAELEARVAGLNRAMQACGGGIEVRDRGTDGVLSVRLLGMCTGCSCRAVTTVSTIRPQLRGVAGVRDVTVENSRVSRHAEERMARAFAESDRRCADDAVTEE